MIFNSWLTKLASIVGLVACLTACDASPIEWKIPNMTPLGPRLESLFHETRTVCFGRFVIDLPTSAHVNWGTSGIPLKVTVHKVKGGQISQWVTEREDELKKEPRYPSDENLKLYLETISGPAREQKSIVSQQSFDSTGLLRIDSYFQMGPDLISVNAFLLAREKSEVIAEINDVAQRLRPREAEEVPSEAGTCIDGAFMVDPSSGVRQPSEGEHIQIGFSLKDIPDFTLSIHVLPGNSTPSESNTFKYQLEKTSKAPNGTFVKGTILRKDDRRLPDWPDGFEALFRTGGAEGKTETMYPHHEFLMDFHGETGNVLRPQATVEMYTGVANNKIGATKTSLTDAEAIALWDKLTSSIRVRPVKAAPKPVSQADPIPLGTVAATGSPCPQTGWWECVERDTVQGGRRQFFRMGERMPEAVLVYAPTLRQRLQGVVPSHRTVTVWKLMERDDSPPSA